MARGRLKFRTLVHKKRWKENEGRREGEEETERKKEIEDGR